LNPSDFVYQQAFKKFMDLGYNDLESGECGAEAVRLYRRNTRAVVAIEEAVKSKKKLYKKKKVKA